MTNQELGENIRKIREIKGFSQQNLAYELDIDQKTVSRIEKGQMSPRFELLVAIAKALSVKIQSLLDFNDNMVFNNVVHTLQTGDFVAYNNTEIEKVEQLYKMLLKEKDVIIELLKKEQKC